MTPVAEIRSMQVMNEVEPYVQLLPAGTTLPVGTRLYAIDQLLSDAINKVIRVHGNGQQKQLDDACLLLKVALRQRCADAALHAPIKHPEQPLREACANAVMGVEL